MCFSAACTAKILCFAWFGATSCILPFLTLHMKALGVPPMASALISGSLALVQLITFPSAFAIVKRTTSYKKTTMWFLLLTAVATILLVFSPRVPRPSRKSIGMQFECGPAIQPAVITDKCNHRCEDHPSLKEGIGVYFTECHVDCPDKRGTFKNAADLCFDDEHNRICHVVEVNNTLSEKFNFGMYLGVAEDQEDRLCRYPMKGVDWHESYYHLVSCPIILMESHPQCILRCDLDEIPNPGSSFSLSGLHDCLKEAPETVNSAIWVYFGIRAVYQICLGIASMLVERGILHVLKHCRTSRTKYSVICLVSAAMYTPTAGVLIDFGDASDVMQRYEMVFILSSSMILASVVLTTSSEVDSTEVPVIVGTYKSILRLMKELEIVALFSALFLIGMVSGFLDVFLFWYLEDMSCPHYVMGATVTASLIIGLPISLSRFANYFSNFRPGYVICICFLLQSARCLGYFFIGDVWWCFLMELIGTAAFHLLWLAVSNYGKVVASKKYQTAFQTSTGTFHYGLGRSCGAYAGGTVMAFYGFQVTFLGFSCASAFIGVLYFFAYHFDLRMRPKNLIDFKDRICESPTENAENRVTLLKVSTVPATAPNDLRPCIYEPVVNQSATTDSTSTPEIHSTRNDP